MEKQKWEKKEETTEDLIHLTWAIREHIGHFVWSACQLSTGQLMQHSQMVTQHFVCVCVSVWVYVRTCVCVCVCLRQRETDRVL